MSIGMIGLGSLFHGPRAAPEATVPQVSTETSSKPPDGPATPPEAPATPPDGSAKARSWFSELKFSDERGRFAAIGRYLSVAADLEDMAAVLRAQAAEMEKAWVDPGYATSQHIPRYEKVLQKLRDLITKTGTSSPRIERARLREERQRARREQGCRSHLLGETPDD